MAHLLRRAENRVWNQPKGEKYVADSKGERSESAEEHLTWGMESLKSELLCFHLALVHFLTMLSFCLFRMVTRILCHVMLEVGDLFSNFNFMGVTIMRLP